MKTFSQFMALTTEAFVPGTAVTYQKNKKTRGNATISSASTTKRNHFYIDTETEGKILVPVGELEIKEAVDVSETFHIWKDYSDQYEMKKAGTDASTKKPIYHVHHKETGEKVGEMHPSTSTSYTHSGRGNVASGAKNVTNYDVRIPGASPNSRGVDRSTPKKALAHFAKEHQFHLSTKKTK